MRYAMTTVALPHLSLEETVQFASDQGYEGMRLGLDVLGPYLAHVYVGGHGPEPDQRDEQGTLHWKWRPRELSDGLLSMPHLLSELCHAGYDGFITVEDLRQDIGADGKFSRAIGYLRGLGASPR